MSENDRNHLKIKRISMVDQVCDNIKNLIVNKPFKSGDKLPPEAELASTFGVNRLTVRMALQKLSTIGLVETRVGEGSFVREFTFSNYLNEISDIYLTAVKLDEIRALRRLIELESTKLSIQKEAPEEEAKLKKCLDEYLQAVADFRYAPDARSDKRLNEMVERDLDFHYQICCNSHNALFRDLFKLLRPLIKEHLASLLIRRDREWVESGMPDEGLEPHEQLYNGISNKDWRACKRIYLELIDFIEQNGDD